MRDIDAKRCRCESMNAFQQGIAVMYSTQATDEAREDAIIHLHCALEWLGEYHFYELEYEIYLSLAEIYEQRIKGEPLENAYKALKFYQKAIQVFPFRIKGEH